LDITEGEPSGLQADEDLDPTTPEPTTPERIGRQTTKDSNAPSWPCKRQAKNHRPMSGNSKYWGWSLYITEACAEDVPLKITNKSCFFVCGGHIHGITHFKSVQSHVALQNVMTSPKLKSVKNYSYFPIEKPVRAASTFIAKCGMNIIVDPTGILEAMRGPKQKIQKKTWITTIFWFYGPTGCGKSQLALSIATNPVNKFASYTTIWYNRERKNYTLDNDVKITGPILILEEIAVHAHPPIKELNMIHDACSWSFPVIYGNVPNYGEMLIILSNESPYAIYGQDHEWPQLKRRLMAVYEFRRLNIDGRERSQIKMVSADSNYELEGEWQAFFSDKMIDVNSWYDITNSVETEPEEKITPFRGCINVATRPKTGSEDADWESE
jgi:hypothetical protein